MASFRPFPPQSSFPPPNQPPLPPPHPLPPNPYPQNRGFAGGSHPSVAPPSSYPPNFNQIPQNPNFHHAYNPSSPHFGPSRQHPQSQQYPYQPPSYPPPANPMNLPPPPQPPQSGHPLYYPSSTSSNPSQFPHFDAPPPPPPPVPPPPSSPPPPPPPPLPPPSLPPPPPPSLSADKEIAVGGTGRARIPERGVPQKDVKPVPALGPVKQHKVSGPPVGKSVLPPPPPNGRPAVGRVETEEERRIRKKKEYEKHREEERRRQQMKAQANVAVHKPQMVASASGVKAHGSMTGSRMAERRATPVLGGERFDNRLKKPTTFLCKLKFRNELPDPTDQPKLLAFNTNKDQYTKYTITSLEKMHKPKLFVEPDLGIPLDLLDISVYNTPKVRQPLAPEDEELLQDDEAVTPVKLNGIRRKDRPTDKGVSWLVKTQYISPLSTDSAKMSITEKQAKELRETREGRNLFLENLNNREKQIQAIEESFKAAKLAPVHQTNPNLKPVEILPLLPNFDRYEDKFVMVAFDSEPTADTKLYRHLNQSVREEHESRAIMKSFVASGSDPSKSEKFLAYMAPAPDELSKDMDDEQEDMSYSWVREYHWDVRGDDVDDPTTYLVSLDENAASYLPLPTRLVLQKKKAKEGRSGDEVEHYPVPSRVTVRRGSVVSVEEVKDSVGVSSSHGYVNSKVDIGSLKRGRSASEDDLETQDKTARHDADNFSGEEDMSD
ncbi:protein PAF1 [Cinnamomum micranthum f. kanehirae]|uniref:Protein PAF1 n=1 Tax=Cinnamomum micranthum f. kanehirae TaxID=337451 RepID=A0A3S3MX02_9MAGN|nr:protein PAF1 [Cinnamomum micranthum f. kanehirae]